jgi:hypothetical protein
VVVRIESTWKSAARTTSLAPIVSQIANPTITDAATITSV